jgi:hypothetical protein
MIKDKSLSDFCGCTVEEGDIYECHEAVEVMDGMTGCGSKDVKFRGLTTRDFGYDFTYVFATNLDLEIGAVVGVED